jgi:hypothetical protein
MAITLRANSRRLPGYNPIWVTGDAYYYAAVDATSNEVHVLKATSIAGSWVEQDPDQIPTSLVTDGTDTLLWIFTTLLDSTGILHVVFSLDNTTGTVVSFRFNTNTDTWVATGGSASGLTVFNNGITGSQYFVWTTLSERGNGDIVVTGTTTHGAVMGDDKDRVSYRLSTDNAASWGAETSIDDGGDIHYGNVVSAPGSQSTDVHFYYQRQTSTANDPPISWSGGITKTLSTSTLSAAAGGTGADTAGLLRGQTNAIRYNTGTAQRFILGGANDSGQVERSRADEDGANDLGAPATESSTVTPAIKIGDEAAHACIVGVDPNGDIHWVYSDATDSDIYHVTSTDDGNTLVSGTATELFDGVTANWPSASFIDGYGFLVVWEDGLGNTVYAFNNAFSENDVLSPTSFGTGLAGAGTALTITNVNTTDEWDDGSTNIPATGTGFYTVP